MHAQDIDILNQATRYLFLMPLGTVVLMHLIRSMKNYFNKSSNFAGALRKATGRFSHY
jgi:hypothetical protein